MRWILMFLVSFAALAQTTVVNGWGGGSGGGATSVGLSMPSTFCSVTNSPVTSTGTLTCSYATGQTANLVFGTDGSGNVGLMNLTGAQLPNPSASTLGGVQSYAAVTHQFLTSISTSGVPASAQPAASDISGLAASATTDTTNAANISSGTLSQARGGTGTSNTIMPYPTGMSSPPLLAAAEMAGYNNAIISSSVDANGNPNFLGTAANNVLPINGGTTSLKMYIGGYAQVLSSNVTLTLPTTASVQQWILAKQDTSNAAMVAGDFVGMNTAPQYSYTAPTCPSPTPSLSSTNPAFWFDLSSNTSKLCTTNGGSYSASPAIVIGVVDMNATPAIDFAVAEPFRLNPYRRYELFGTGADGALTVTSGTTTIDTPKQYASAVVTGGTLNHTAWVTTGGTSGVYIHSQNPVLVLGGTVTASGLGRSTVNGGTSTGGNGASGGLGGAGGGGGGSGTTNAAGGTGGSRLYWLTILNGAGGSNGTSAPTVGGAGPAASNVPQFTAYPISCMGASGGAGAGDGTNAGGSGGAGGGAISIWAPAIYVATGVSVVANGNNGGNGAGGNAGGGGGGGGGCLILNAGYLSTSGATITANGGSNGTKVGTGANGGAGGTGVAQQNKLW